MKHIVILHPGSSEIGFIPECGMNFVGVHDENEDYHTEMNTVLFMEWHDKLLRALARPSVTVLDKATITV